MCIKLCSPCVGFLENKDFPAQYSGAIFISLELILPRVSDELFLVSQLLKPFLLSTSLIIPEGQGPLNAKCQLLALQG